MFTWITNTWHKFEAWVAKITPGIKTEVVTGLGAVSSFAAMAQQYITSMPTSKFITAEQISAATFILFTLSFWLRGIGDRVQTRDIQSAPKALDTP